MQTTSLGNAYGLCVMFVTFFDTCLVSLAAIFVWNWSPYVVFLPWLTIACLDGAYLSSALLKVPVGAWFTLTLAAILAAIFLTWRFGKEQQWAAEAEDRFPTSHFVTITDDRRVMLNDSGGAVLNSSGGLGIFFDKAGETTPTVFSQFISKLTVIPEIMVFLHLRPLEVPTVGPEERYAVSRLGIPNCYRIVVRYGFNDVIVTPNLAQIVYDELQHYLLLNAEKRPVSSLAEKGPEQRSQELESEDTKCRLESSEFTESSLAMDRAFKHKVLYVIGKEQMKIKPGTNYFRLVLLNVFLWIRENSRNKMANLNIPIDKLVEVGFLKEI